MQMKQQYGPNRRNHVKRILTLQCLNQLHTFLYLSFYAIEHYLIWYHYELLSMENSQP